MFYRVWETTEMAVNPATGLSEPRVSRYTELGDGLNYWENGQWVASQDLIEITADGAAAVRGPTQVRFSPEVTSPVVIELVTASGKRFQSRPIGLFYFDAASGKRTQIASLKSATGLLYPPNQIVYPDCFEGVNGGLSVKAALSYTYTKGGFDQAVAFLAPPPAPEQVGLNASSTRVEVWTAFVEAPTPTVQRRLLKQEADPQKRLLMVSPDLTDDLLDFGDLWFPTGGAFLWGTVAQAAPGAPAQVTPADLSDPNTVAVGKQWLAPTADTPAILIESADYADLAPKFGSLAAAGTSSGNRSASLTRDRQERAHGQDAKPRIRLAAAPYSAKAVVIDYTSLSGSANSYLFLAGETYFISNSFSVGSGAASFGEGATSKFMPNAYLLTYGPLSFPASGPPVVFTSADDNNHGDRILGHDSGVPSYAAAKELWIYYVSFSTTVRNARFRWAQRGVQYDANPGIYVVHNLNNSVFEFSNIGAYLNLQNSSLYLSGDKRCEVITPIYRYSGSYQGNMTADCGVASIAEVNTPEQDWPPLDPTGDPNKNSQTECSFVVVDSSTIVAAFMDTHLTAYGLGLVWFPIFINGQPPRATGWAVSTDGGLTFTDNGPLLPNPPPSDAEADTGDPVMARDASDGTLYLMTNPSRATWTGFRLWVSTNNGQSFTLRNANVPGSGYTGLDKPALAANNYAGSANYRHLYMAGGRRDDSLFVTHSADQGVTWDVPQKLDVIFSFGADLALLPGGTVYLFFLSPETAPDTGKWLKYSWLPPGQTTWHAPVVLPAHADSAQLYSTATNGSGDPKRSNSAPADDYFVSNAFPHVAVNPVSGKLYVVYADLPSPGATTDRGDIFINEGVPNPDGSLNWTGVRKVNNDSTQTDQWNPSVVVNPAGTHLFVGYYSRQTRPSQNDLIKAYGAKAKIVEGLQGATFDVIPISASAFPPLFAGAATSTPPEAPWLYDPVFPPADVCLDGNARVDLQNPCPVDDGEHVLTDNTYVHFMADDYTWAAADGSYFYFAWCDRSRTYYHVPDPTKSRPDANVRLARVRQ
jgi:hypothetical protein